MTSVEHEHLAQFREALDGCRFCPMCKPANEVANLVRAESHSTRSRAMILWRVLRGISAWTPRIVELLYQSTLDDISEAWCVSHYPVSAYVLAARADAYQAGMAPPTVVKALRRETQERTPKTCETLLLASEVAETSDPELAQAALRALAATGTNADVAILPSGALAYCLGDRTLAREQANRVATTIASTGATTVIADGPQTAWLLTRIFPALDVQLPNRVLVATLADRLADMIPSDVEHRFEGSTAFVHDSRSAFLTSDRPPHPRAIQPGGSSDEVDFGIGAVYDSPRAIVDALGFARAAGTWTRGLSRSTGADAGLWLTYPGLASRLAREKLDSARSASASHLVTSSILDAVHLRSARRDDDPTVVWLPELIAS